MVTLNEKWIEKKKTLCQASLSETKYVLNSIIHALGLLVSFIFVLSCAIEILYMYIIHPTNQTDKSQIIINSQFVIPSFHHQYMCVCGL